MEGDIVATVPHEFGLAVTTDPNRVLAEAHRAARALKDVVSKKEKPVIMNGEQYLEFEDWQTLAKFYNVTAKVTETKYVEFPGGVRGYEAKAVAFHGPTGIDVSAAESMCLNDEDKWSTRAKYEYQNGKRVKVGEVTVPLFQLKSMAQTRACAKALRNCLAWVVVLAGYKPSVAEEMTGDESGESSKPPIKEPQKKKANAEGNTVTFVPETVSVKEGKGNNGPWTKYGVKSPDGEWFGTFDKTFGALAQEAKAADRAVVVGFEIDGKYKNIVRLTLA